MNPNRSRFETLAGLLGMLASPVRLEILHAARTPQVVGELRIAAERTRGGENADRLLSRQAVAHHAEQLQEAGLLARTFSGGGRDAVVLDHARLFALVDEVRSLSKLRSLHGPVVEGQTMTRVEPPSKTLPSTPRLLLAYGRDDAVGFAIHGDVGARWRIGRSAQCDVIVDYDPYASAENATIERTARGYEIQDAGSRNGTWLDWEPLRPGVPKPLRAGGLILVGRSLLVFQQ